MGLVSWLRLFFVFFNRFFSQFHLSTLSWLRIWLYIFLFTFYWVIAVSRPGSQVLRVSKVGWSFFLSFFNWFFFHFHPSTLGWLKIWLYILFYFILYIYLGLIIWVWQVNSGYFFNLFFSIESFNIWLIENYAL